MQDKSREINYRLNQRDELVFVNEAWDIFASSNCGAGLTGSRILGRSLWDFIADPATRVLYRDLMERARGGHPVRFALRCDSPACRRRLEMTISGGPAGVVEFAVRTLSAEPRPPQLLLDSTKPHSDKLLRMCGWCKKVDVDGRWLEVEEAVSLLALFDQPLLPGVTHGICGDCYARMASALEEDEGMVATPFGPGRGSG